MKNLFFYSLLFIFSFNFNSLSAQNTDSTSVPKLYKVTKSDGSSYVGFILKDDGREVLIKTEALGNIYIYKSDIKSIRLVEENEANVNGVYRDKDAFTSRYHFTTNSLPIVKGEAYSMINLYGPEIHYAASDRFSVGVMSTWIASPIAVALKYTIPTSNKKINFGIGSLLGSSGYIGQFKHFGGLYWGMMTIGDAKKNITFSAGFAHLNINSTREVANEGTYYQNDFSGYMIPTTKYQAKLSAPSFSIGVIAAIGEKANFVLDGMVFVGQGNGIPNINENYIQATDAEPAKLVISHGPPNKTTILYLMPGVRFQKDEKRAFQVALAGVTVFSKKNAFSFPVPTCSWFFKL